MLKDLTLNVQGEQTMSSREIAELTGKQHGHVLRDCDRLNEKYENLHLPRIGETFTIRELPNGGSTEDRAFLLTKIQTFDLMTGYNTELRIKVNRRWAELEEEKMKREKEVKVIEPTEYEKEALKARLMEAEAQLLKEKRETIQMVTNQVHKDILIYVDSQAPCGVLCDSYLLAVCVEQGRLLFLLSPTSSSGRRESQAVYR